MGLNILFWVAVVMLVDAAIGLWNINLWQKIAPRFPIQRVALIEAATALVMIAMYFVLKYA